MRNIFLTLTLLVLSWTASYAQAGKDTSGVYYTQSELIKIADDVERGHECDSLLGVSERQLELKTQQGYAFQMALHAKDTSMANLKGIIDLKEGIITGYKDDNARLEKSLKVAKVKTKAVMVGWAATTVGLIFLLLK